MPASESEELVQPVDKVRRKPAHIAICALLTHKEVLFACRFIQDFKEVTWLTTQEVEAFQWCSAAIGPKARSNRSLPEYGLWHMSAAGL